MLVHKRTAFFEGKTIKKKRRKTRIMSHHLLRKKEKTEQGIQNSHIKKRKFVCSRFVCCASKYTPINLLQSVTKLVL